MVTPAVSLSRLAQRDTERLIHGTLGAAADVSAAAIWGATIMQRDLRISAGKLLLMCTSAAALAAATSPCAQAQSFSVVQSFNGTSGGGNPVNGLTLSKTGMLFGTTSTGGASGLGVVFKLTGKGAESVLHSFAGGADGATPNGSVVEDTDGSLYGTTTAGGASGFGTVFRVKGTKESVLYSFADGNDGAVPEAGLVIDAAGNFYGTTNQGGPAGNGTVFKLAPPTKKNGAWTETVLYSFGTGTDGANPVGGVHLDKAGNLYGTTSVGGAYGFGTVFELVAASGWKENVLHDFQNTSDGTNPYAGLISDKKGNLYGAATDGGVNGGGTIFELSPSGGSWNFTVLTSLPGWGISGTFRDLLLDTKGNLYGTTHCDGDNSAGTIFELTPSGNSWTYTLLYTFTGGSDGLYSISNLVLKKGALYGTTLYGGADNAGDIYELTP
jgi:uncharacterized repeat protein (TIGR03803 family)